MVGIWDCMTSQEAIDFVRLNIAQKTPLPQICEILMDRCLAPESDFDVIGCDNMTVIIVALLNGKSAEQWYENISSQVSVPEKEDSGSKLLDTNLVGPKDEPPSYDDSESKEIHDSKQN